MDASDQRATIRNLETTDLARAEWLLDKMAGRIQVRGGMQIDVLALPGFIAVEDNVPVGVATYSQQGDRVELAVLAVREDLRGSGVAGRLIDAVQRKSRAVGAQRCWLVTTNDNLDALRLYQRHGFRLVELRPGAVDEARKLKPAIPMVGDYGIPLRDELVLELSLRGQG